MPRHPENHTNYNHSNARKRGFLAVALASLALAGAPEKANGASMADENTVFSPSTSLVDPTFGTFENLFTVPEMSLVTEKKDTHEKKSTKADLAKKILQHENVAFWNSEGVNTETVFKDLADNEPGEITCGELAGEKVEVKKSILKFVLSIAEDGSYIMVNAVTDKCHSDGSNHYEGEAVDLDCTTEASFDELESTANKFDGENNGENCSTSDHYHFDF